MKRKRKSQNSPTITVILLLLAVVAWIGVLWRLTGADAAKIVKEVVVARNTDAIREVNALIDRIINWQLVGPSALNAVWIVPVALILVVAFALFMAGARNR